MKTVEHDPGWGWIARDPQGRDERACQFLADIILEQANLIGANSDAAEAQRVKFGMPPNPSRAANEAAAQIALWISRQLATGMTEDWLRRARIYGDVDGVAGPPFHRLPQGNLGSTPSASTSRFQACLVCTVATIWGHAWDTLGFQGHTIAGMSPRNSSSVGTARCPA